jgi:hypothetical protein
MRQQSVTVRNAKNDAEETAIGVSAVLKFFASTTLPADCAAADIGSAIAAGTLPANWMNASANGVKDKAGITWTLTGTAAAGTGTNAGSYRMYATDGTTCHEQGTVTPEIPLVTSALTAAMGNILNFAATTGVVVGMHASGTGVPTGARVLAVAGTTVTLSHTCEAGVGAGVTITFGGDMVVDNVNVANNQAITVSTYTKTAANA